MMFRNFVVAAGLVGGALLATFAISSCLDELMLRKTASLHVVESESQATAANNAAKLP
jgi:hypothetical protein